MCQLGRILCGRSAWQQRTAQRRSRVDRIDDVAAGGFAGATSQRETRAKTQEAEVKRLFRDWLEGQRGELWKQGRRTPKRSGAASTLAAEIEWALGQLGPADLRALEFLREGLLHKASSALVGAPLCRSPKPSRWRRNTPEPG